MTSGWPQAANDTNRVRSDEPPTEADVAVFVDPLLAMVGPGESPAVASRAFANALVIEIQEYLDRTSTADDVELFFEVHGREPADVESWPLAMLTDLHRRHIDATEAVLLVQSASARAAAFVRDRSPLAWEKTR